MITTRTDPAAASALPRPAPPGRAEERAALGALGFILAVTAAWWWLALGPSAGAAPGWLHAARAICFGTRENGLPDAGGWILLVGEPLGMLAALLVIGWAPLASGVRRAAARPAGRAALGAVGLALLAGAGAAGWRVTALAAGPAAAPEADRAAPTAPAALLSPLPPLPLVDQRGDTLRLERFRGRPVLVTFAYAHCETECPLLVQNARAARERLGPPAPALVVVTLDPWRDVPSRLPHMARAWRLPDDALVVGGEVAAVESALAAWGVPHHRDARTGQVAHLPLTFVVDTAGGSARRTTGAIDEIVRAAGAREGPGPS